MQKREALSKKERKEYIEAVKCLWTLPSVDPEFSAAQNHFDDYVAVHMNQTNFIHGTANFLPWHRYLIYLWEQKLRTQCGYKGYLPVCHCHKLLTETILTIAVLELVQVPGRSIQVPGL